MREVVDGARRIRIEEMRENQYIKGYAKSFERKIVERNGGGIMPSIRESW